ncbi:MAG: ribonuclease III [Nibricoccus sp.]
MPEKSDALLALQQRLAYTFRDPRHLVRAITHPSYLHDNPGETESNQRLEFLGDAVLQLVLTEALYNQFPTDREGALSKSRATLTKGVFLATLAQQLELPACLRLSASEEQTGGRERPAAHEDAFEALIGAVYLDSDYATARRVLLALYGSFEKLLAASQPTENPKGRLQELVQPMHGNHAIRYEVVAIHGEDHAREFEIQIFFNDQPLGIGRGKSKKTAEEAAARLALEKLSSSAL